MTNPSHIINTGVSVDFDRDGSKEPVFIIEDQKGGYQLATQTQAGYQTFGQNTLCDTDCDPSTNEFISAEKTEDGYRLDIYLGSKMAHDYQTAYQAAADVGGPLEFIQVSGPFPHMNAPMGFVGEVNIKTR